MADSAPVPTLAPDPAAGVHRRLQRLLARVQAHLNLHVAFVSEPVDELRVVYYPHPLTASPAVSDEPGIGRHVSVPIVGPDGTRYGTLCAGARHGEETLNDAQLASVRLMAEVVADYLEKVEADRRDLERRRERLRTATGHGGPRMQLQPVVRLATGELAGAEALARFPQLGQGPAEVFDEAWHVGMGVELEMAAVHAATDLLELIPEGAFLAVNVAPATLVGAAFAARAAELPPGRLVAEVTEHAALDVEQVDVAAERLGVCGVRCAVDDVGTGFSGLDRILQLGPDILKIDKSLVRGLDACPARHALISALVSFTRCTAITTVAEGIETAGELAALRALGVDCGQGYHLAPPREPGRFGVGRPPGRGGDC